MRVGGGGRERKGEREGKGGREGGKRGGGEERDEYVYQKSINVVIIELWKD